MCFLTYFLSFSNPFFSSPLIVIRHTRIEFSPAIKKEMRMCSNVRIEFSPANKKEMRMCPGVRVEFSRVFLRTKK
jgi:hypothetical protein